jgi:hypothetical protein
MGRVSRLDVLASVNVSFMSFGTQSRRLRKIRRVRLKLTTT